MSTMNVDESKDLRQYHIIEHTTVSAYPNVAKAWRYVCIAYTLQIIY